MIVTDPNSRNKMADIHPYAKFLKESPTVFIPLTDPSIHPDYHQSDTSLACIQFMIMAHSLGLATCWAGVINKPQIEREIKQMLNIPEKLRVLALVAVGYPDHTRTSNRKEMITLLHREKY
jgi:nitroreductase